MDKQDNWLQANEIFNSDWFVKVTKEFDDKMMHSLKYGDPEANDYKSYAYMVKGVTLFMGMLRQPLKDAEAADAKQQLQDNKKKPR